MCAEGDGKACRDAEVLGDQRRGNLVHIHAAVLLGHIHAEKSEPAKFFHQIAAHVEVLRFDLTHLRKYLLFSELGCQTCDLFLFRGEVFKGEYIFRVQIFDEEASPGDSFCLLGFGLCDHRISPDGL